MRHKTRNFPQLFSTVLLSKRAAITRCKCLSQIRQNSCSSIQWFGRVLYNAFDKQQVTTREIIFRNIRNLKSFCRIVGNVCSCYAVLTQQTTGLFTQERSLKYEHYWQFVIFTGCCSKALTVTSTTTTTFGFHFTGLHFGNLHSGCPKPKRLPKHFFYNSTLKKF